MNKSLSVSKPVRIEPLSRFARGVLPKKFRAMVAVDKKGRPAGFLFDTYAFWEFLCRIDEKLLSKLPDKEYVNNPVGRLIDEIEENWPFDAQAVASLNKELKSALRDISAGRVSTL